jgi:hypothetical protein
LLSLLLVLVVVVVVLLLLLLLLCRAPVICSPASARKWDSVVQCECV